MLLASFALTWYVLARKAARRQAQAVEKIHDLGGSVVYDFQKQEHSGQLDPRKKSSVPAWLLRELSVDFFHDVLVVDLSNRASFRPPRMDLSCLAGLPELQHLYLPPSANDEDMKYAAELWELAELSVQRSQVSSSGLAVILYTRDLRFLSVAGSRVSSEALELLSERPTVERLVVDPTQIDERGIEAISQLPKLKSLWIEGSQPARIRLEGLANLKVLAFEGTQSVEFAPDIRFDALTHLFVRGTSKAALDAILANLERMPNLERLEVSTFLSDKRASRPPKTFLNDDRLRLIAGAQQLLGLNIKDSPDVTDAGLKHLRELSNLEQLRLERVPVSADGLGQFKGLENLEWLAVSSPRITPQQLKVLKATMPNVQITP